MITKTASYDLSSQKVRGRFTNETSGSKRIVVSIPGGPAISGYYMDAYTKAVAIKLDANGLTIDLPNHGSSCRSSSCDAISYATVRTQLIDFFAALSRETTQIVLIGHSFGALIALDLMQESGLSFEKVVLVSMPVNFEGNSKFTEYRSRNGLEQDGWSTEKEFSSWWRKLIPFYFHETPPPEQLDLLTEETCWIGNERYDEGLPSFDELTAKLRSSGRKYNIVYLEGEHESILPDDNFQRVVESIQQIEYAKVERSGHFPMLENLDQLTAKTLI